MSLTNTVAAKFFGAFVAVAMLFTLATPASAQTTEELQAMINDLLAQVAALQGTTSAVTSDVCPYTWTRTLNMGASGADVMKLQQFLNSDPDTRVAASGVGSAGMETDYYGGLTGAAVAKFQTKYRSEILTPLGLVNATTFFGNSTKAQANDLCMTAPVMDDTMDDADDMDDMDDDDSDDSDDNGGPLSGGEADLTDFNAKDGDDTNLEEGQSDAPVMDIEFDVEDGDIEIRRLDVAVDADAGNDGDDDPWDVFEEISIWVDGDKVAEMDVDDEDEWEEDDPNTGDFKVRFSGLDLIFREDDEANITIGVTLQSSIDGTSDGETWAIFIPNNGIRGVDSEGVDQYTGDTSDTVDVDIEEEGSDDELKVQTSTDDPDSTTIAVDEDDKSDWVTIFAFDLDSDDSVNDITVDGLVVNVVTAGDIFNDVVDDVQILVNGEVYDDTTISGGTTATATVDFDTSDDDFMIDAGDEVTVEFQVEFNALTGNYSEGQTIYATTSSTDLDAEGADDLTGSQLSGSATGETHTLRSEGAILEPGDTDTEYVENDDQSTTDNEGIFTIEFDVTAFETDIYVDDSADRGTTLGTAGANYTITSGGSVVSTGTTTSDLSSTGDLEGSRYLVNEGDTETFTLTVEFDPATGGFHRLNLYSLNWAATNADPTDQQLATPAEDYRTNSLSI